jgi:prevent-host-death family protein
MADNINLSQDILDLNTAKQNLEQLVEEVNREHAHKVIIQDNKPAAVLVNVEDYQELQEQLLAMELQMALYETKEAEKKGELVDWDEQAAELGIELKSTPKPEGYDQMIPARYCYVS